MNKPSFGALRAPNDKSPKTMTYEYITYATNAGVGSITLNRPDVLNSFNASMADELQRVLADVTGDDTVRAVLLSGAGRAFCAGQDLAEVAPRGDGPMADLGDIVRRCYNPIIRAIRHLEKPVVAAVNGVAAGAGANLAFACDFVLAAEEASFIQSFCKVGLIPDSGGTYFIARLLGPARAFEWMSSGQKLTAAEAHAWGLVSEVVEADALPSRAAELAATYAALPTRGIGMTKRLFDRAAHNALDEQLELEAQLQAAATQTEDFREGVTAFLEKRDPRFEGR